VDEEVGIDVDAGFSCISTASAAETTVDLELFFLPLDRGFFWADSFVSSGFLLPGPAIRNAWLALYLSLWLRERLWSLSASSFLKALLQRLHRGLGLGSVL
jgi:hypothetical protein